MKKLISVLLSVSFILTLAACGNNAAPRGQTVNQTATVQDILDNAGASSSESTANWTSYKSPNANRNQVDPALAPEAETPRVTGDLIDLTKLSSTMVYSEVYNMMATPEDYVGKTIIMEGAFDVYETPERNYYACLIADASACCAQGVEFVLSDDLAYPEDYPEPGASIKVTGTFETYLENGAKYCQLGNASFFS